MKKESKVISLRIPEIVEKEAADWLVKLDSGKFSVSERESLRAWLNEDPSHAISLKNLASIWSDLDEMLNDNSVQDVRIQCSFKDFFARFSWVQSTAAVVGAVLIFAITSMFFSDGAGNHQTAFYVTEIGDQRIETLPDGSIAHLNTDSMIETEFTGNMRIIRLLRGEALFDVTHDPERPFVVYVGDRIVRAIGTRFVVRLKSENILVTVTEGQVELTKRIEESTETVLAGNQTVTALQEVVLISDGEAVEVHDQTEEYEPEVLVEEEIDNRLAWATGQLVFKDERLEQVVAEVGRYVPGRIVIDDPELADIRVNGRFQIGDTEALLEAMEISLSIKTNRGEDQIIRLAR